MKWFRNRSEPIYSLDPGKRVGWDVYAFPKADIPELAAKYFAAMETEESEDWCACPWQLHPEDVNTKKGECRECGAIKKSPVHIGFQRKYPEQDQHLFAGRRMRRVDDAPNCPVHTREGMLIHFFEWAKKQ